MARKLPTTISEIAHGSMVNYIYTRVCTTVIVVDVEMIDLRKNDDPVLVSHACNNSYTIGLLN